MATTFSIDSTLSKNMTLHVAGPRATGDFGSLLSSNQNTLLINYRSSVTLTFTFNLTIVNESNSAVTPKFTLTFGGISRSGTFTASVNAHQTKNLVWGVSMSGMTSTSNSITLNITNGNFYIQSARITAVRVQLSNLSWPTVGDTMSLTPFYNLACDVGYQSNPVNGNFYLSWRGINQGGSVYAPGAGNICRISDFNSIYDAIHSFN